MTIVMHWQDWLALFAQYLMLSLLSISGGAWRPLVPRSRLQFDLDGAFVEFDEQLGLVTPLGAFARAEATC